MEASRAERTPIAWSARVRRFNDRSWHAAVVLDLSLTGALLQTSCPCEVGEWIALDIEPPGQSGSRGTIVMMGPVVRNDRTRWTAVAMQFLLDRPLNARAAFP